MGPCEHPPTARRGTGFAGTRPSASPSWGWSTWCPASSPRGNRLHVLAGWVPYRGRGLDVLITAAGVGSVPPAAACAAAIAGPGSSPSGCSCFPPLLHVAKGLDVEEAVVALGLAGYLASRRDCFPAASCPQKTRVGLPRSPGGGLGHHRRRPGPVARPPPPPPAPRSSGLRSRRRAAGRRHQPERARALDLFLTPAMVATGLSLLAVAAWLTFRPIVTATRASTSSSRGSARSSPDTAAAPSTTSPSATTSCSYCSATASSPTRCRAASASCRPTRSGRSRTATGSGREFRALRRGARLARGRPRRVRGLAAHLRGRRDALALRRRRGRRRPVHLQDRRRQGQGPAPRGQPGRHRRLHVRAAATRPASSRSWRPPCAASSPSPAGAASSGATR